MRGDQPMGSSAAEYVRNLRVVHGASVDAVPSMMAATVDRQVPQRDPAPVFSMTSAAVDIPEAAASRISFSVTAIQMQTYISRPTWLVARDELLLRIAFKFDFVNRGQDLKRA
jgi:hypothetical protein